MPGSVKPSWSVIIPSRGHHSLTFLVKSLFDQFFSGDTVEVIVVNDGKHPEVSRELKELAGRFTGISEMVIPVSKGSYAARNAGLRESRGTRILLLDDDVTLHDDTMIKLKQCTSEAPYVAGKVQVAQKPGETLYQKFYRLTAFPVKRYLEEKHFGLTGFLAIHHSVLQKAGMFNEDLYSGGDFEFGRRVYEAGIKQKYCPEAVVYHPSKTWKQHFFEILRIHKGRQEIHALDKAKYQEHRIHAGSILRDLYYLVTIPVHMHTSPAGKELNNIQLMYCLILRYSLDIAAKFIIIFSPRKRFNT